MIKPLADRVLIKPKPIEEKTKAGIIIPNDAQMKQTEGEVVAVGGGMNGKPMQVKVGDKVIYGRHSGAEIVEDGETYLIIRESDILIVYG